MRFGKLGPSAATTPSARMKLGNAESMSISRITISSTTRPRKPAIAPKAQPTASAVDRPGEDVEADRVCAERMLERRRAQRRDGVACLWPVRRNQRREDRAD